MKNQVVFSDKLEISDARKQKITGLISMLDAEIKVGDRLPRLVVHGVNKFSLFTSAYLEEVEDLRRCEATPTEYDSTPSIDLWGDSIDIYRKTGGRHSRYYHLTVTTLHRANEMRQMRGKDII